MGLPASISISSLSGSGKTKTGDLLLAEIQKETIVEGEEPWQLVDLGLLPRKWAKEKGQSIEAEAASRTADLDKKIDEAAREAFRRGHSIVLGRLPWWVASESEFNGNIFRVWLHCPPEVCAERRWRDQGGNRDAVLSKIVSRNVDDARRYKENYNLFFPPLLPPESDSFDLVVSTVSNKPERVVEVILECARCWAKGYSYVANQIRGD